MWDNKEMIKKKYMFDIFKHLSGHRLDEIKESLDLIEGGLKSKFEDWGDWYEKRTKGWSDDERSEFIDHYYDDLAMVRDTAPNMARQAMCVCLSGYFETFLADSCRFLHRGKKSFSSPKQKLYLEDSKEYLIDVAGFDEKLFNSEEWTFCVKASYVRNAIAHCDGRIPNHVQGNLERQVEILKQFVSDTDGIKLTTLHEILIEAEYCKLVVENIGTSIDAIIDTIERDL